MSVYQKSRELAVVVLVSALLLAVACVAAGASSLDRVPGLVSKGTEMASVQPMISETSIADRALNSDPPGETVKLVFVHHSVGRGWLNGGGGNLGDALGANNYYVSDTYYGWGPRDADVGSGTIGDHTDIGQWYNWFVGPHRGTYLNALYTTNSRNASYSRPMANPGGQNEIVMFKSCYPNSQLKGNPDDPPTTGNNPLRGQPASSEHHTVGNAKGIYNDLLAYFSTRQDKLFVVIAAPPVQYARYAANARAFNNWLVDEWLADYTHHNVVVFDYFTVLTTNGGDPNTNDYGRRTGNHHRLVTGGTPAAIEHIADGDDDDSPNVLEYPGDGNHPSPAGHQKATGEFIPLLNAYYNCWKYGQCQEEAQFKVYLPLVR